jgi:hypothetical protein
MFKKRDKKASLRTPYLILVSVISLVLVFVVVGLLLTLVGGKPQQTAKGTPGLGELGAACGGPMILPCSPGSVCSVSPDRWATEEGVCVKDTRPAPVTKNQGEPCNGENEQCAWGFVCQTMAGESEKTCQPMIPGEKPFIMAIIPDMMKLISGMYQAKEGTKVPVTVRATGVTGGALYLRPLTASHTGVLPGEKISDLAASDVQNEYKGSFTVSKHLGAELIAVMQGKDGQEITLGVTVGAQ